MTKETLRADSDEENQKVEAKARKDDKELERLKAYFGPPFHKPGDVSAFTSFLFQSSIHKFDTHLMYFMYWMFDLVVG